MIVKGFQLLGVLFPIVVIVTADYFLKDVTPATTIYSVAASFMGVLGVTVMASMVYFVTVIPTSFILLIGVFFNFFVENNFIWLSYFNYLTFSFLLFSLYFFREPNREIVDTPNQMLSPADGKVVQIIVYISKIMVLIS